MQKMVHRAHGTTDFSRAIMCEKFDEVLLRHGLVPAVDVIVVPANTMVAPGDADLVLQCNRPLLSLTNLTDADDAKTPPQSKRVSRANLRFAALKEISESIMAKTNAIRPG